MEIKKILRETLYSKHLDSIIRAQGEIESLGR